MANAYHRIGSTYFARDVYHHWKKRISQSKSRITIFTPYLDKLVVSLISHSCIEIEKITIVTDFNEESLMKLPGQLRALKKLLSMGVRVLISKRLHAKVLLTDEKFITVGSQNFTSYARRSRECSVVSPKDFSESIFLKTLVQWRIEAVPIDEGCIDLLIGKTRKMFKELEREIENARDFLEKTVESYELQKKISLINQLESLELKSKTKIANGVAFAERKRVGGNSTPYETLRAGYRFDLTKWKTLKSDGNPEEYALRRLYMYPVMFADTNRMGFARIGATQISYVRNQVDWKHSRTLILGDFEFSISLIFPAQAAKESNIVMRIGFSDDELCRAYFVFTGSEIIFGKKIFRKGRNRFKVRNSFLTAKLEREFFSSQEKIVGLFGNLLSPFKFKSLGRDKKNVQKYLAGENFRLSVIEFLDKPILVIKKMANPRSKTPLGMNA